MPPLPDSMRFLGRGWWWLHLLGGASLFCWGWYLGQNRAQRRIFEFLSKKKDSEAGL